MSTDRVESAYRFRIEAAEAARKRDHSKHKANPDEARYGAACYPMSFTKGLEHDEKTGLVKNAADFEAFRTAIDNGFAEPFTTRVPVPGKIADDCANNRRQWEAPTAGTVFELEGPDPQAVTMPPAPELGSAELTYEMAEVYELALLRDVAFTEFQDGPGNALDDAIARLNALQYTADGFDGRPRKNANGGLDAQTAFRGSSPGSDKGPYLSQFMLIGNASPSVDTTVPPTKPPTTPITPKDGYIAYGAQFVDQRVLQAEVGDDYMMTEIDWRRVQDGFDTRGGGIGQKIEPNTRFITTVRDLATYVHIDALYQAYLNACLILLSQRAPFDPAFDLLSGMGPGVLTSHTASPGSYIRYNAGGFALWGGPHILSLVTEVATRGLKAVRYQKFNVHARLRPEALAGRLHFAQQIEEAHPSVCGQFSEMCAALDGNADNAPMSTLGAIKDHNDNAAAPNGGDPTFLLPMAFAEGSPMHPAYGAGHATVAGACVTMLKAFFDTSAIFVRISSKATKANPSKELNARFVTKLEILCELKAGNVVEAGAYTSSGGDELDFAVYGKFTADNTLKYNPKTKNSPCPLTLEGELNKLAANISIGRNMAGVHYFSDYFDSIRMGERIAIGILEEQALGYQLDPFVMSVPTFDGPTERIGRR